MSTYSVQASKMIPATPNHVYGIISDYHEGHQAILPRKYFDEMVVLEGGQGAGTRITVEMTVMGVKAFYDMKVTEPEPGRVLQEQDNKLGVITTFTVEPRHNGSHSHVTIATEMTASPGVKGWIEKWMNPPIMRRIYHEELDQLAQVATA